MSICAAVFLGVAVVPQQAKSFNDPTEWPVEELIYRLIGLTPKVKSSATLKYDGKKIKIDGDKGTGVKGKLTLKSDKAPGKVDIVKGKVRTPDGTINLDSGTISTKFTRGGKSVLKGKGKGEDKKGNRAQLTIKKTTLG
ncbi:MAG: hypothetical protein AAGB29_12505 [Planctomycetota bacterium]